MVVIRLFWPGIKGCPAFSSLEQETDPQGIPKGFQPITRLYDAEEADTSVFPFHVVKRKKKSKVW